MTTGRERWHVANVILIGAQAVTEDIAGPRRLRQRCQRQPGMADSESLVALRGKVILAMHDAREGITVNSVFVDTSTLDLEARLLGAVLTARRRWPLRIPLPA